MEEMEMWGQAEIAAYGEQVAAQFPDAYPVRDDGRRLPRRRVEGWTTLPGFPDEVVKVRSGRIWYADDVKPWVERHLAREDVQNNPKAGFEPALVKAILADRGLLTMSGAAAKHGVSKSAVGRIWLDQTRREQQGEGGQ